jgi:hypothetical protein
LLPLRFCDGCQNLITPWHESSTSTCSARLLDYRQTCTKHNNASFHWQLEAQQYGEANSSMRHYSIGPWPTQQDQLGCLSQKAVG